MLQHHLSCRLAQIPAPFTRSQKIVPRKMQVLGSSCFTTTKPKLAVGPVRQRSANAALRVVCSANGGDQQTSRRELVLHSVNVTVLGALLAIGATPRPRNLGVQDYGGGIKTLGLCPPTPNCISTAEEANDPGHYVPAWTYNPPEGRGKKNPATKEQAFAELEEVVSTLQPDKFTPKIVKKTSDYLYVEYESPTFGFIDDVEFYFPPDQPGIVEYRSASRVGESDFDINRKRIKAIRLELQKKGWKSVGF